MNTTTALLIIFLLLNVVTFCLFWWDKDAARNGGWRVSEARLLQFAVLGGSLGAVAAQRLLRHGGKAIGHALRQRIPLSTGFDDKAARVEPDYEKLGPVILYGSAILFTFPFLVQIARKIGSLL